MINFDDVTKEETQKDNPNWWKILDHWYRILKFGGSRYRKENSWFNLTIHQPDVDKIYLYAKDPYEAKDQFLINKEENIDLKHLNDLKFFIEYPYDIRWRYL